MGKLEHFPVVIIGAGIGGLTLGAFLRQLDVPFVILERTAVLTPAGAGISLAPNCLRSLEQLGLLPYITARSQELLGIKVYRGDDSWGTIDFGLAKSWFGYNVHSIERHDFHRALYEAAGGSETVRLGCAIESVIDEDIEKSAVRVQCADGGVITADVVVGADGIRSTTRRALAAASSLDPTNTITFTGRVHMSGYTKPLEHLGNTDIGIGHWILYDDATFTTWPCQNNRQWFIGVKRADLAPGQIPDRSVWKGATPATVNEVYGNRFHPFGKNGTVKAMVDQAERVVASNVFEEIEFPHMVRGRVALLGDAAHSMTSFFGQGACQAIEDATVLADHIVAFLQGDLSALNSYAEIRKLRSKQVANFSAAYASLHTAKLPLGCGPLARYMIYRWVPSSAWMWYLQWLYGYQPVSKALDARRAAGKKAKKIDIHGSPLSRQVFLTAM